MNKRPSSDAPVGVIIAFIIAWLVGVLLILGFWAVVIWAVIRVVLHFT